jgi:hypothetical protein
MPLETTVPVRTVQMVVVIADGALGVLAFGHAKSETPLIFCPRRQFLVIKKAIGFFPRHFPFMSSRQKLRSACDTLGDLVSDFQPSNYSNLQISVFHQAYAALHDAEYNATMWIYDVVPNHSA